MAYLHEIPYDASQFPVLGRADLAHATMRQQVGRLSKVLADYVHDTFPLSREGDALCVVILRGGLLLYPAFFTRFLNMNFALVDVKQAADNRVINYDAWPKRDTYRLAIYLDTIIGTGKTIQTVHGVVESRYKIDEVLVCSLISSRQGTA
ncbi:MAG: hypothetical protein D6712_08720, partial [Chloroflexi bacterium]